MKRILLDSTLFQRRAALVDDRELIELIFDQDEESIVGNIYAARVENVLPGMRAAFLDIGMDRNAYYYYGHKDPAMEQARKPQSGQQMMVQVQKPGAGAKGPVVVRELSFPGKFLVLLPGQPETLGVSRKITDTAERERIRGLLRECLPQDCGAVVRTDGEGKTEADYRAEILRLWSTYQEVARIGGYRKAPALLYRELDPILKSVRDLWGQDVEQVLTNDEQLYERLLRLEKLYGKPEGSVQFYQGVTPLFGAYHVETQAEKAFQKKVWLKSGGFLIIEQTEACVVVDVNTGKFTGKRDIEATFFRTNLEAAQEIAKQLRLRNLSGLIVVDFIDLKEEKDKAALRQALIEAVSHDRVKTVVVGMTELGLMQLTRKKTGPSLQQVLCRPCPHCGGNGVVPSLEQTAAKMAREVLSLFTQTIYDQVTITAAPALIAVFAGPNDARVRAMEEAFGKSLVFNRDDKMEEDQYCLSGRKTPKEP